VLVRNLGFEHLAGHSLAQAIRLTPMLSTEVAGVTESMS
jgi:hypothetical protein